MSEEGNGMKVAELVEKLSRYHGDCEVYLQDWDNGGVPAADVHSERYAAIGKPIVVIERLWEAP